MERAPLSIVEHLQKVDVLRGMSREELTVLFKGIQPREYSPGALLFTPDEPSRCLFILKVGHVDVYRLTSSGKRLVIRRLSPGMIFGEMGLLGQSLQGCFAEAAEHSLVCVATGEQLLEVLRQRPDIALRILEAVGKRLTQLEERLEQALFSPVRVRLATFLLTNSDPLEGVVTDYTHQDIGDTIGALRQTVTETLGLMQDQGLVEVKRKQIRITDRERLTDIALGEEVRLPGRNGDRGQ